MAKADARTASRFTSIFLDGMFNGGHQEFADSATYGPWGTALTTEFIPKTESYFRAVDSPSARFVSGHSSGGWSALWLQVSIRRSLAVSGRYRRIPSIFAILWAPT